ncbi:HNH endonuclease [Marinomonas foliarum]|uniref:Uncharacterized protein (TIGR02646 family) n=1 Tax=Marinomonas foliarum TaxID=491950 RepID=A0A368ZC96_9GAMM|nr:HNH endonuclease [Marinomonas foliarum]RCW90499.1 uncharacterized protein (TIGR02646 family) [Marinomonas foliarum]
MRPVRRGDAPVRAFNDYKGYLDFLLDKIGIGFYQEENIGMYCSYCERNISSGIEVEHLVPKSGDFGDPDLELEWRNFLLSCRNCNATKSRKQVLFDELFFPDRDNTFLAFTYELDGHVRPADALSDRQRIIALATIELLGLNAPLRSVSGVTTSKDRRTQRINAFMAARSALDDYLADTENKIVSKLILKEMIDRGHFSIWMKVFSEYPEMLNRFIEAIKGTRESGCFDDLAAPISPHPNHDRLDSGSKI